VRRWAKRGTWPRQPADQRYDNAYLFGAICPARGVRAALALPHADADMMQLHLDEISRNVAEGAHAVLILDRAGWHTTSKLDVPDNITPIFLPSRAPELNPVENVWQYLRQNWLSTTVFENYDAIVDAACEAWRKLIADPQRITSIGMRDWAPRRSIAMTAGIMTLSEEITALDRKLLAWHAENEVSQRLTAIPGLGIVTATAITTTVTDPDQFRSGRQFAAWLGLTPQQHSTGGKTQLEGISKQGDRYLRRLLVVGATAVIRHTKDKPTPMANWIRKLLVKKPFRVVSVALANKLARIAWVVLARKEAYRPYQLAA
jgi:hypothetical protein